MDVISSATATATPTHAGVKTPEAENETPSRVQPSKPFSFPNGVLKRHHPLQQQQHHHHHLVNAPPVVVTYKECQKNHAASLGGRAFDGCGEFMPSPTATPADPTSLKCAACGCHRNFHRRDPDESLPHSAQHFIEFQPHHRHHPPPPPPRDGHSSPDSPSPLQISSAYYPSAPHMLLALSAGLSGHPPENHPSLTAPTPNTAMAGNSNGRKRFRTKFTQDQKDKMYEFAERVGWKIQKRDEDLISEFCSEVGVDRGVLKVWMHNNKNTLGKKDVINTNSNNSTNGNASGNGNATGIGIGIGSSEETTTHHHHHNDQHNNDSNNINDTQKLSHHLLHNNDDSVSTPHVVTTNGTPSSS